MTRSAVAIVGISIGLAATAAAAVRIATPAPDVAADPVPVLVELFTSEGCSSCPPADNTLIDLLAQQPVPGAVVLGLSEHVDYWDRLGWKDPFSARLFSDRQSSYAASTGTSQVYTPQMLVDGSIEFNGSDRAAAIAAIRKAASTPKPLLRLEWTTSASGTLTIALDAQPRTSRATVYLAVVEDGLSTAVRDGENAGRTLSHSAVTRRLVKIGDAQANGAFRSTSTVEFDPAWKRASLRVIVFAQRPGKPVVAVGTIRVP